MSPRDEAIDLDEPAWNGRSRDYPRYLEGGPGAVPGQATARCAQRARHPAGPRLGAPGVAARPDRGVLFLYALDPAEAEIGLPSGTPPVIAFAISFPASSLDTSIRVEYKVNTVLWEQEYGGVE